VSAGTTYITQTRVGGIDNHTVGIGAVVIGLASLAVANFVTPGDNGGGAEFATLGAFMVLLAVIMFGRVVPRAVERGHVVRTALILTALSAVGAAFFWAGLAQVTAPAAVLLGTHALSRADTSRRGAVTAIVLSGLFYLATLVASVVG
jgi:hypothetical protein